MGQGQLSRCAVELKRDWGGGGVGSFPVNRQSVGGDIQAFRAAAAEFGLAAEPDLNAVLRLPGALDAAALPADGSLEASVLARVEELLKHLNQMREEEGRCIDRELRQRMAQVQKAGEVVEKHRQTVLQTYVERRKTRMQALIGSQVEPERPLPEGAVAVGRRGVPGGAARERRGRGVLRGGARDGQAVDRWQIRRGEHARTKEMAYPQWEVVAGLWQDDYAGLGGHRPPLQKAVYSSLRFRHG